MYGYCRFSSPFGVGIFIVTLVTLSSLLFLAIYSVFKLFIFSIQRKHIFLSSCTKWFYLNTLLSSTVYTSSIIQQSLMRGELLIFLQDANWIKICRVPVQSLLINFQGLPEENGLLLYFKALTLTQYTANKKY